MFETRIAAAPLSLEVQPGFPREIDMLAERSLSGYGFLRAAWFRAGAAEGGQTVVVRRACGTLVAALPTCGFGPMPQVGVLVGARKVPGSYWPFRSVLLAPDCDIHELAAALARPEARKLGTVWRLGPTRSDDPAAAMLVAAARMAGWSVLSRPAGTAWLIDCNSAAAAGSPRPSLAKKLRAAWRKLETLGTPHWRLIRGAAWNEDVLEDLGRIEAASWIARSTDGSGAKFLHPAQRALWHTVLADPVLAENLAATILMLDERPLAFSFDLVDGAWQYGIAGSYDEDFKRLNIGKIVNYRALEDAIAAGRAVMDMGVGDTGYKREMGAVEGYQFSDLLFVRSRTAARVLTHLWGEAMPAAPAEPAGLHG